jgi:hypothetical protein
MNITGYVEDFLTLWALTHKTKEVLTQLEDEDYPNVTFKKVVLQYPKEKNFLEFKI